MDVKYTPESAKEEIMARVMQHSKLNIKVSNFIVELILFIIFVKL